MKERYTRRLSFTQICQYLCAYLNMSIYTRRYVNISRCLLTSLLPLLPARRSVAKPTCISASDEDREISVSDEEISVSVREISMSDREISVSDREISVSDREISVSDKEISVSDREISV